METTKLGKFNISFINHKELISLKNEIFINENYHFDSTKKTPVIIDAGAHIGLATLYFKSLYPEAKIYAFEPNWQSFELLQTNIEANSLQNIALFNKGLAVKEGIKTFYIDGTEEGWDSTASLYKGTWLGTKVSSEIKVQMICLSTFLASIKEKEIDLLKLDIEGSEQAVLKEAGAYLSKVKNIILEFHPIKGNDLSKVIKLLTKAGFKTEIKEDGLLSLVYASRK